MKKIILSGQNYNLALLFTSIEIKKYVVYISKGVIKLFFGKMANKIKIDKPYKSRILEVDFR